MIAAALLLAASVGTIEFFGYKGLDVAQIRAGLPVSEGGPYREEDEALIRKAAGATDVAAICCDEHGNRMLYIGLPGASCKKFSYNPEPKGDVRLPAEMMDFRRRLDQAIHAAVRKGEGAASEDDSNGYALIPRPRNEAAPTRTPPPGPAPRARAVPRPRILFLCRAPARGRRSLGLYPAIPAPASGPDPRRPRPR